MVGRLGPSTNPLFEPDIESFTTTLRGAKALAQTDADTTYRSGARREDAVASEPTTFPLLENIVYINTQNILGAGITYYVTKVNGEAVTTVADNSKTPGLFNWAAGMRTQFSEQYGTESNGVWTVGARRINDVEDFDPRAVNDNAPYTESGKYKPAARQPELEDIERTGPTHEFPGVIRYEIKEAAKGDYGGEKYFYASKSKNSPIYGYVMDAANILGAIAKASAGGVIIADHDTVVPHLTQINPESIKSIEGMMNTLAFDMQNGDQYFVTRELSPNLYAKLEAYQEQKKVAENGDAPPLGRGAIYNNHINKVELNKDGEALPEGMLLVTLKGHPTFGDGTYLVTESSNSQAYDTALNWHTNGANVRQEPVGINNDYNDINAGGTGRTKDAREFEDRFDVSREDWDIMSAKTDVRIDETNNSSRLMTVGEVAMKKLREKYEAESNQNPDSKAAKFIALLDAIAAYSSGRSIPAYTQGEAVSAITGEFYAPSEDWQGVLDYNKLMAESNAIWQDGDIQKAYSEIVSEVIGGLNGPSMEDRAKKLSNLILGDPADDDDDTLALWLADMKAQKREGEAEVIVQSLWSSLAFLDKPNEEGAQALLESAMNEFQIQALMVDLSSKMEEGIGNDAYSDASVQSNLTYILNLIKASPNFTRLAPNAVNFIQGVLGGKIPIGTATKVFGAIEQMQRSGLTQITPEEMDKFLNDRLFVAPGEKEGAIKMANDLNKIGMLGTVVGGVALGTGIARITRLDPATTKPEDFMLITRDFMSFLSFSEHYAKGMGSGINKVASSFGKNPNLIAYFGLNSSLPEIWGNDGRWGKTFPVPKSMTELFDILSAQGKTTLNAWATQSSKTGFLAWDVPNSTGITQEWLDHFKQQDLFGKAPATLGGKAVRFVGSAIKILGNGLDAPTGIIDIVFNSLKLARSKGDPHAVLSGVLGLLGGVANTGAGAISGVNALFRTLTFASMSSPLFIIGTILGVVSALIELFDAQRETDQKLDKQRQWLATLVDADVIGDDWGKAFEFINTWYAYAGGRNDLYNPKEPIPLGLSVFDYDRERWNRFRENWEPGELPREEGNFFNKEELQSWWENEASGLVFTPDFSSGHHNPSDKLSPDHPARKELETAADGLSVWYKGNLSFEDRRLATFGNDEPKRVIELMASFYLTYIDAKADSGTVAGWIMKELEGRIKNAFGEDGDKAWDIIKNHYDLHDGNKDMVAIIDGTKHRK